MMPVAPSRGRLRCILLALAVIAAGITLRSSLFHWLPFIPKYGGDALWTVMFFLLAGAAFPRLSTWRVAAIAITISLAIEFFKLYHQPDLDRFRETLAGQLTLGKNFSWSGMAAYIFGGLAAARIERRLQRITPSAPPLAA